MLCVLNLKLLARVRLHSHKAMTILRPKQLQALLYRIIAINSFLGRYNL